eukprot:1025052-Pelagomonas_calceolata.AAC.2
MPEDLQERTGRRVQDSSRNIRFQNRNRARHERMYVRLHASLAVPCACKRVVLCFRIAPIRQEDRKAPAG